MALASVATPPTLTEAFGLRQAALEGRLADSSPRWLSKLRRVGLARFEALGLPTPKLESWKYTNLRPLERLEFRQPPASAGDMLSSLASVAGPDAHRVIFVDGRFDRTLSTVNALPDGVELTSLAEVLATKPELVREHLGAVASAEMRAMVALNTAFIEDGFVLHLGRNVTLDQPVEFVFVNTGAEAAHHPRNLILAEIGATATVVEHHVGPAGVGYFANSTTEILVGDNARVRHYRLQAESDAAIHIANVAVRVGRDATYDNFVFSLGARLSRNEIHSVLAGTGATCHLNGGYMIRGEQHADTTTLIEHAQPHGGSRETYKGVIDGSARAVFQGKIHVHRGAQKTDGYQLNRALLLSDSAEIDSKPELEIYADDVKCSHGATAGQLDEEAMFYLRSRGIPMPEARGLLIQSFVGEALAEINDEAVREAFAERAQTWLKGMG